MGLEVAIFISELVLTNPLGTDLVSSADNHMRLTKTVLQNTFPNADKAFYFPHVPDEGEGINSDLTIVTADMNRIFPWEPSGSFMTFTLPTLDEDQGGWECSFVKTANTTKHCFIEPASGLINGVAKVRRTVPFTTMRVLWTGGIWVAQRQLAYPLGTAVPYTGTIPKGCLPGDGTTFVGANYPELNAALGGTTLPNFTLLFGGNWAVAAE